MQQEPVDANDRSEFPAAKVLTFKNRRFALGIGIKPSSGQKVFTASELSLSGSWEAVFPLGLDRYPRSGAPRQPPWPAANFIVAGHVPLITEDRAILAAFPELAQTLQQATS